MDFLKSSEVDVAYYILSQAGEKMYYKDLVLDVIEKTHKPVQSLSAAISEVYTLINGRWVNGQSQQVSFTQV